MNYMGSHPLNDIAEAYIQLCFAVERLSPGYVDAYYGPPSLRSQIAEFTWAQIGRKAAAQIERLEGLAAARPEEEARRCSLLLHLQTLNAYTHIRSGEALAFDQESSSLYDVIAPQKNSAEMAAIRAKLEELLPGRDPLYQRMEELHSHTQIPPEKLDGILAQAINEARRRTAEWVVLPEGDRFQVEYVTNQPWSGYNWYLGQGKSLIQINRDLPAHLDLAIALACHEGYPGHHLYHELREQEFYHRRGWVEFSIYPLFGPDALLAEGSANFGIKVAFPTLEERIAFEQEVLCTMAGLDPEEVARYDRVAELASDLAWVEIDTARSLCDGRIGEAEAERRLVEERLLSPKEAAKEVEFIRTYRAYVICYKLGMELVKTWVEERGGTPDRPRERWQEFLSLLVSPVLPADLQKL